MTVNPKEYLLSVRPEIIIFLLSLMVFSYFIQGGGWNQNSRLDLVRSMVEHQTFKIDKYHKNTGDKAKREGHYYSDKAPGTSFLATIPYSLLFIFGDMDTDDPTFLKYGLYLCTLFAISLPSAISVWAIFFLFRLMNLPLAISTGLALAYAFGTLTLPYSTMLFGHQLSASFLILSFVILFWLKKNKSLAPRPLFGIGLFLGFAFVTDYSSILAIVPLLFYGGIIFHWSLHAGKWIFYGLSIPAITLMFYNWMVFGSIIKFSYQFAVIQELHQGHFLGLSSPQIDKVYQLLFSHYRGLFFSSPWLMLAFPGLYLMVKRQDHHIEGITCLAIFILFLLFNSSFAGWHGGWAFGPRYLIPSIPFVVIIAGALWLPRTRKTNHADNDLLEYKRRDGKIFENSKPTKNFIFSVSVIYSTFIMFVATSVNPLLPDTNLEPHETLFLGILRGDLVHNLGEKMGYYGFPSLVPLLIIFCLMSVWLFMIVSKPKH